MDISVPALAPAVPVAEKMAADSEGRGWYPVIKGLVRAAEVWIWVQILLTVLGLVAGGVGMWMCWQALKYTAWMFGL